MTHECPECAGPIDIADDVIQGEIVPCASCGVDLEVHATSPVALQTAPDVEEDWGE